MENMQYAEELVREFLVFRGLTNTLQAFETELCTDIGKGFEVNKILDLIFAVYIPKFQAEKLVGLFSFFKQCSSSWSETMMLDTLSKLEGSVLRCYIVHALQSGRKDKVVEFFRMNGNDLLLKNDDWTPWFGGFICFDFFVLYFFSLCFFFWLTDFIEYGCSHSLFKEPKLGSSVSCLFLQGMV